jgi:hypothetical protein
MTTWKMLSSIKGHKESSLYSQRVKQEQHNYHVIPWMKVVTLWTREYNFYE